LQNKKLRTLIRHAYERIPYYHQEFKKRNLLPDDIRTVEDLEKLPYLTKDIIRENFSELFDKSLIGKRTRLNQTSGSSGEPLRYYLTLDGLSISWAAGYRAWNWGGYELGDKRVMFGSSVLYNLPIQKKIRYFLERNMPFSSFNLTEDMLAQYVSKIRRFNPKFIRGYPSTLYILSSYLQRHNIDDITPESVFTTAETLFPFQRRLIETVMGCPVSDGYGCRDGGANAMECGSHEGYHICSEQCYLETIDSGGRITTGNKGEIVTTDFHNYAMPFIRYKTGDIGTLTDEECSCGRGLPLMKSIEGRIINLIYHSNGNLLSGLPLTDVFEHIEERKNKTISQYQIIQETRQRIVLQIVKGENYTQENSHQIISEIKKHVGQEMDIQIEFTDNIPLTKGGKRLFVICKIPTGSSS
jgi:phenylacetate-CoA ligase